jgi:hypothetical protein
MFYAPMRLIFFVRMPFAGTRTLFIEMHSLTLPAR